MDQKQEFRRGIGIMLVNDQGKVWVGERLDQPGSWQMPQGGIDENEEPIDTAYRELFEETGINKENVSCIAESADWLTLLWPEKIQLSAWNGRFKGQIQKWFLFQLNSAKDTTVLTNHIQEFSSHKWVEHSCLPDIVVDFKQDLYKSILNEFKWYFND